MPRLNLDCVLEILECSDHNTLYKFSFINRDYSKEAVRILWRDVWIRADLNNDLSNILITLIACLPDDSKEYFYEKYNEISKTKSPWHKYASYCKVLNIRIIKQAIKNFEKEFDNGYLLSELLKMFMNEVGSLKSLECSNEDQFSSYPGAKHCLKNLSELKLYGTVINQEFFKQLSKSCRNIKTLDVNFFENIYNDLAELISKQENLTCVKLFQNYGCIVETVLIQALSKQTTIEILEINSSSNNDYVPNLSFIKKFKNLRELCLYFSSKKAFKGFDELQVFRQLKVLKVPSSLPENNDLIKFLNTNGNTLEELHIAKDEVDSEISKICSDQSIRIIKS
ncbi:8062_t:CDS:1 [Funneliformis mosseae]|uniref:8062_t:CDS:1 n=1 Tax=Funneliformis mosseae TaxID=27381 RepID=A0A9N9I0F2_FUNMO|nr:8062_t:CDS:1 [Funneliformis mosseae]